MLNTIDQIGISAFNAINSLPQNIRSHIKLERLPDGRFSRPLKRPTIKQLWKFSDKYVNEIFSNPNGKISPAPMEPIKFEDFNTLSRKFVKNYNKFLRFCSLASNNTNIWMNIDKKYDKKTSNLILELRSQSDKLCSMYSALYGSIRWNKCYTTNTEIQNTNLKKKNLQVNVFNQLLAICNTFETSYVPGDEAIRIKTPSDIVLYSRIDPTLRYEFGSYYIYLLPDGKKPTIKATTPKITRRDNAIHPHVKNTVLCYGDGKIAAEQMLINGELFVLIDITIGVLNTYGPNPYYVLEDWKGICDVRFDPETGKQVPMDTVFPDVKITYVCTKCNARVDKLTRCSNCNHEDTTSCLGCLNICSAEGCNNLTCDYCTWTCDKCQRCFCGSRHFNGSSVICNECQSKNS